MPDGIGARQTTRDWFENGQDWGWSGVVAPAASAGSAPAQGMAPASFGGGGSGMITVEGVMPHGGGVPMMYAPHPQMQMVLMPVTMVPPEMGGQAVQFGMQDMSQMPLQPNPNRGARWPEPMPTVPEPNAVHHSSAPPPPTPDASSDAGAPQPQTLTRTFSINSACFRVHWVVDARKLRGNDKQAVSPPFELSFGSQFPNVTFKMMIYPKIVNDSKGGASFKKAKGRGYVQLKCEAELSEAIANVSFRISIGSGDKHEEPRGPVSHNFSSSAVCGLPKDLEEWDFASVVDQESMTFVVCLEIVPKAPGK